MDHSTFQNQIRSYLGGTPDTAYTWFSGYRMKFFADQGLNVPIDDVWAKVKGNFTEGFANSVVGNDGKVYGIPVDYYPWAVFYRKSVFADKGYTVPATWDDLKALCTKMQADGLIPIAFGDKDGWPAMGTFDILNLRLNGYDFHVGLMAGKEKWTDPKVTAVFQKWAEIVPFHAKDYAGLTWQNAADTLVQKKSGMYLLGLFVSGVFAATKVQADLADLDFFAYPTLGTQFDDEAALDAPIDTWQIAAKSPNLAAENDAAKAYLEFWAKGSTQGIFFQHQPGSSRPQTTPTRAATRRCRRRPSRSSARRQTDHPVPRPRHPPRLLRSAGHAGFPSDVPEGSEPGPGGAAEVHPGLLGFTPAAGLT